MATDQETAARAGGAAGGDTMALAPIGPMLRMQTRAEFLKLLRSPGFTIATLVLPTMFFAFFGLPNAGSHEQGINAGAYLLASFGAYGVVQVMLFSFGVGVAVERGQKMTVLMRATPLSPLVYLGARVLVALAFGLMTLLILFAFATVAGGIRIPPVTWVTLLVRLLLGALPFIALGFAIGYLASPGSAAPITNLAYLPLSFASGLFIPIDSMPKVVQDVAPYLPTYHYGQLAWNGVGARTADSLGVNILWLLGYGAIFVAVALRAYYHEERRSFG